MTEKLHRVWPDQWTCFWNIEKNIVKAENNCFWLGIFLIKILVLWLLGESPALAAYDALLKVNNIFQLEFYYPCSMTPAASYEAGFLHISPYVRQQMHNQWLFIVPISGVALS